MTLILALSNPDYAIQISDRQLTAVGGPVQPGENKTTLLTCLDARLLVGFTGLARANGFRTARWLLDALADAAPPDYFAEGIVKRSVRIASDTFKTPAIRRLRPRDRRLSVMFTGFAYWADPPLQVSALVSNFQDFANSRVGLPTPWEEFQPFFLWEKRPPPADQPVATYMQGSALGERCHRQNSIRCGPSCASGVLPARS
ncbi:MAG: hypothetical protein M3P40_01110 [Actinomycetota bacterium]|nr:hypothetical protein [Actinomycetota bacterium]